MKTINKVIPVLLFLAASALFAQNDLSFGYRKPEAETKTFVQKVNDAGWLVATVQDAAGGYVTVSGSGYFHQSILVRKIRASGQKVWERTLNLQEYTEITGIAQTTDGGFAIVGYGCKDDYCDNITGTFLLKLLPNGSVAWINRLAVTKTAQGYPNLPESVIATSDGGVISIGAFVVVMFTANGEVAWMKSFQGSGGDKLVFVGTHDNAVIVAARIHISNRYGVDVMKIAESGNVLWRESLAAADFVFQSAGITTKNGVILVGNGQKSNKLKVVVLNADGTFSWKAGYSLKHPGRIQSVASPIQTPDDGYVITGSSDSLRGGFIAKIDSSRKLTFQNTFGASVKSVFDTLNGSFLLFGSVDVTSYLVSKVNSEGMTGCGFFKPQGAAVRTPFGALTLTGLGTVVTDLSIEAFQSALSSVVTNHSVTNICH